MTFKRNFNSIKDLEDQPLYEECLLTDIKSGVVFPAVRNNRIDFYYLGSKLFSFDHKNLFSTHLKYASVAIGDNLGPYVTQEDLKEISIANFVDGYERIKENCAKHSKKEALGVSQVYGKYSCANAHAGDVVVLDIEVSLRREDDEYEVELLNNSKAGSDRMDLLLLNTVSSELCFFEAKHYSNDDIRGKEPKIVAQMRRYSKQLKSLQVHGEIVSAYKAHRGVINGLLGPEVQLPEPKKINPYPCLLVFGFDREQREGKLKKEVKRLVEEFGMSVYTIGNIKNVNANTIFSAAKIVRG
jgi:hypothetical protein